MNRYGWTPRVDSWSYQVYRWGRVRGFVSSLEGKNRCGFHWLVASVPVAWFFHARIVYRWMTPCLVAIAFGLLTYIVVNAAIQPGHVTASAIEGTLSALFSVGGFFWLMRRRPDGIMRMYDGGMLILMIFACVGPFLRRMSADGDEVLLGFFAAVSVSYLIALFWTEHFPFKRQVGNAICIPFIWFGGRIVAFKLWLCPHVVPPEPDPFTG